METKPSWSFFEFTLPEKEVLQSIIKTEPAKFQYPSTAVRIKHEPKTEVKEEPQDDVELEEEPRIESIVKLEPFRFQAAAQKKELGRPLIVKVSK